MSLAHWRLTSPRWLLVVPLVVLAVVAGFLVQQPKQANAQSNYLVAARTQYPSIAGTALDSCRLCHTDSLPALNPYGQAFKNAGHNFQAIELLDSDGDGFNNIGEIQAGAQPGEAASRPQVASGLLTQVSRLIGAAAQASNAVFLPAIMGGRASTPVPPVTSGVYKIIGWNDLGMHCMNQNYANLVVLPPYNTMYAEVIKQGTNPQLVTSGIVVEYYIEGNTTSANKVNFWQYAQQAFHLAQPLPPNVGLAGAGLSGKMTPQPGGFFKVEGIPLTPFLDSNPTQLYPYQIAHLTVKDAATGQVLAETRPVAPTSTEMNCQNCHSDGQRNGIATGNVETNILTLHDQLQGTKLMDARPVLCADCHASNALGKPGVAGVKNLSLAMHGKHSTVFPLPNTMDNTCYQCHPGPKTQCLRDVMANAGLTCISCHGDLKAVADPARNPWVDEPKCGSCHESKYAENTGKRYRDSTGHGGLFCETCHGSPHAILPSSQPNDNIQNIALQGNPGKLEDCHVCHGSQVPSGPGPHGQ